MESPWLMKLAIRVGHEKFTGVYYNLTVVYLNKVSIQIHVIHMSYNTQSHDTNNTSRPF